jgi:hypothetical protein
VGTAPETRSSEDSNIQHTRSGALGRRAFFPIGLGTSGQEITRKEFNGFKVNINGHSLLIQRGLL